MIARIEITLALATMCAWATPSVSKPAIRTIDYPQGFNTNPRAINDAGVIAGSVTDDSDMGHGFIRATDGSFTLFDPPGGTDTVASGINTAGTTVGYFTVLQSKVSHIECFIRSEAGAFTVFEPTGGTNKSCEGMAINDKGSVAGQESQGGNHEVFLLNARDRESIFLASDSEQSTVTGMNNANTVIGLTANAAATAVAGFLRTKAGLVTIFDVPGDTVATYAEGINSHGVITGSYSDSNDLLHGYVRSSNSGFTTFDVAGADQTTSKAINAAGEIAGSFVRSQIMGGFLRAADGKITSFAPVNFPNIVPACINASGVIAGQYTDAQGAAHGFIRMP
jgi:hypothetical protein